MWNKTLLNWQMTKCQCPEPLAHTHKQDISIWKHCRVKLQLLFTSWDSVMCRQTDTSFGKELLTPFSSTLGSCLFFHLPFFCAVNVHVSKEWLSLLPFNVVTSSFLPPSQICYHFSLVSHVQLYFTIPFVLIDNTTYLWYNRDKCNQEQNQNCLEVMGSRSQPANHLLGFGSGYCS